MELAVNGFLNEQGMAAFDTLCQEVERGYKKPWFHGIENMTIDHTGYVKWKGTVVEHYTLPWAYSVEARGQALELARRCAILESRGETPTMRNAIWTWEDQERS